MNKIVLTGHLTKKPELRNVKDKSVCEFTIATNRINGKDADFINCVVWNSQAENLVKYQDKGSLIGVFGELRVDNYEVEGNKRYKTYVLVSNIEFLESKNAQKNENVVQNPFEQFGDHVKTDFDVGERIQIENSDLPF